MDDNLLTISSQNYLENQTVDDVNNYISLVQNLPNIIS